MARSYKGLETKLIHAGEPEKTICGAVSLPIFQSSTFEYGGQDNYHDIKYIRLNNTPNHIAIHQKLASLENADAAVVTASGMAAISTAFLSLLGTGDHLLIQDCLYGGTYDLLTKDLPRLGITFDFLRGGPQEWAKMLRSTTRAIYVETISNPLLDVPDLEAVVNFARQHNIVSIIDNTFASPVNFCPSDHGFDLSIHSCTKYLNGHSDIVGGAVIGRRDLVEAVLHKLNHFGASMDPHAVFLLNRGLKTLALRVRYQNESALQVARFLESHDLVSRVNYPGLASNKSHENARRLLNGFGGVLSLELKDDSSQTADRFIKGLELAKSAPSLGGVETLVTRPSTTSHSGLSTEERLSIGITDGLVRLSVGIETTEDLIADLDQALSGACNVKAAK